MQKADETRQARREASSEGIDLTVRSGSAVSQKGSSVRPKALSYDFEVGEKRAGILFATATETASRFGLDGVAKNAKPSVAPPSETESATTRGGGWEVMAPEDLIKLASKEPPFPLSEDLDPEVDPYAMVEAATRLVTSELRTQPGLATMVQANVSPSKAYELLSN